MRRYIQKKSIVQSKIDEETVMMDANAGVYFGLNKVATAIWDLLQEEHTIDQLVDKLIKEYNVQKDQCLKETTMLIERMIEHNVIEFVED